MDKPRLYRLPLAGIALSLTCAALAQTPAPAAPTAPAAPAGPPKPTTPAMVGSLTYGSPTLVDGGPLGKIWLDGVISGLGFWQDKQTTTAPEKSSKYDLSNGQVIVQNTTGKVQFFLQAGDYSLPALGVPYIYSNTATSAFFGPLPQAFIKFAPTDAWSFEAGKLPTLIGAECTFDYENLNIQRGLLWNQENAVNRGFQANYAKGPLTASASWNDGFYSNRLTWISALVSDALNPRDTVSLVGMGNTTHSATVGGTLVTPVAQNNSQIYNLIWTHTQGSWTITPYAQYTFLPKVLGLKDSSDTVGAAILASYAFPAKSQLAGVSLPARVEYIKSSGPVNLLGYGTDSNAWSISFTPTYQRGAFFLRAEGSYVGLGSTAASDAFGVAGTAKSQTRLLLETGLVF